MNKNKTKGNKTSKKYVKIEWDNFWESGYPIFGAICHVCFLILYDGHHFNKFIGPDIALTGMEAFILVLGLFSMGLIIIAITSLLMYVTWNFLFSKRYIVEDDDDE